jgi:hypothetical protein
MKRAIMFAAAITLLPAFAAEAQPARQQQRQPPQPPAVIIERTQPPPAPPERPINPPRTFQDISPPMQSPTPLSPMAPRVGG